MAHLRVPRVLAWVRQECPGSILEIGAGQGALAARLAVETPCYLGLEPDERSVDVARQRLRGCAGMELRTSRWEDLSIDKVFDLVVACEVLEHLDNDVEALTSWRSCLKPGGALVLSVPAHRRRFGAADALVGHVRRYDAVDLRQALEQAGFEVLRFESYGALGGHLWETLRHGAFVVRRLAQPDRAEATAASGRLFQPQYAWQGFLTWCLALPLRLAQMPFRRTQWGVGWLVLARSRG